MAEEFDVVSFMNYLADPDQKEYFFEQTYYSAPMILTKAPMVKNHQIVASRNKLANGRGSVFKGSCYQVFCIASTDGRIQLLNDNVLFLLNKNPFPPEVQTFWQYSCELSSALLPMILPTIQGMESLQKKYMKRGSQMTLSLSDSAIQEIANNLDYLKQPFEKAVLMWPFFTRFSFSMDDLLLRMDNDLNLDGYAKRLEEDLTKEPIDNLTLRSIVKQVFTLKSDLEAIKAAVGPEPGKSISARKQIRAQLPANARSIIVNYRKDDGELVPIEFNPKYAFGYENDAFWMGFQFLPRTNNTQWLFNEPGIIRAYHNQVIIPWHRIANIVHRKKQIYIQSK